MNTLKRQILFFISFAFLFLGCEQSTETKTNDKAAEPPRADSVPKPQLVEKATDDIIHRGEPTADSLEQKALGLMKKQVPDCDRFYVTTVCGDINADGLKDVVMEYGLGEEGAMRHVANQVVLFMNSPKGLLKGRDQDIEFCAQVDRIENGYVLINELEACMLSWPQTLAFHKFEYRSGRLEEVEVKPNPDYKDQE